MLGVAAATIVGLAMICYSTGMAHIFYKSKRRKWQVVLSWAVCIIIMVCSGEVLRPVLGNCSGQYTGFLAIFVYLYLFDVPVKQRFFTYFFVDTSMYVMALIARYTILLIYGFWPGFNPRIAFVIFYFVLSSAYMILFFLKLKDPIVNRLKRFEPKMGSLTIFACLGYILMLLLFDAWEIRDAVSIPEYARMLLYVLTLGYGYYLSFYSMQIARDKAIAQAKVRNLDERVRQAEHYYTALTEHIHETRLIHHDTKHHLHVLDSYAADGNCKKIHEYISRLIDEISQLSPAVYCLNYTANILLGFYAEQAKANHIAFRCDTQIPENISCAAEHISVLLGNALQNALEACQNQNMEEERFISIFARPVEDNLTIDIENSHDGTLQEHEGRFFSRKEGPGHGYGLESIQAIIRSYSGYCAISHTESVFRLKIVLPVGGPDKPLNDT